MNFAVYIPVGPACVDLFRVQDLIESIYIYEPQVELIVLVDHGAQLRDFSSTTGRYPTLRFEIIKHCTQCDQGTWRGAGCVTNLVAMDIISARVSIDFVLKMDTDALVIGPFAVKISRAFEENGHLGIVGTLGTSCNRDTRSFHFNDVSKRRFEEAFNIAQRLRHGCQMLDNREIIRWNLFEERQIATFESLCTELRTSLPSGFAGEHCQGGAYAISREFVSRMQEKGYLNNAARWLYMPIDEDKMMGAYCASVGLELGDLCGPGDPFGVQNAGLAYPLQEIVDRGYSIIHSLRNCAEMQEGQVRQFFSQLRSPALV